MILALSLLLAGPARAADQLTILHTNDWQSGLTGVGPDAAYSPGTPGDDETRGGVARLAALVEERRAAAEGPVLLLDGGDVTMGTLFHTVTRETGAELQLMKLLRYDAITLGNHEFDFRPGGLGQMIASARAGEGLPPIVATNLVLDPSDPRDDMLERLYQEGILERTRVLEKEGLKIGLIGILGVDATEVLGEAEPVTSSDPVEATRRAAWGLNKEGADIVIVLSHSGVRELEDGSWGGEEVELMRAVPAVDVIVGGHSHTALHEPILVEGRPVLQAGSETRWLGELKLKRESDGQPWQVVSYTLHPVDDRLAGDAAITARIDALKQEVDTRVLGPMGYRFDQPVAEADRFHGRGFEEHVVGNLVTDAIRHATGADIAVTGNGTVRADIDPGEQRVSDLFRIAGLGIGILDDSPGYALVKGYLSGPELKSALEFLLIGYTLKGPDYYPRISGAKVVYNPNRVPFDRIVSVQLGSEETGWREADLQDADARYSIAATTYVAGFLPQVSKLSYGILDATLMDPKDRPVSEKDLRPLLVDADPGTPGVQELKDWKALLDHVSGLPDRDGDGLADIPGEGPLAQPRLVAEASWAPAALLRNATWRMWSAILVPGVLLVGLFGGTALVARRIRRRGKA